MPMVQVRDVRMLVHERLVSMNMRMGLANGRAGAVPMPVGVRRGWDVLVFKGVVRAGDPDAHAGGGHVPAATHQG